MSLPQLNSIEPPWYGPVCPVVGEGRHREVSPYPDLMLLKRPTPANLTQAVFRSRRCRRS